jgi:hypothetical protein
MAKKKVDTFESVSKRIGDLKECEQTPEIQREIDELTEQLEDFPQPKAEPKDVESKKELEDFPQPKVKAEPKKSEVPIFTHEEWRLEKKVYPVMEKNGLQAKGFDGKPLFKVEFPRVKMIKKVIIHSDHENNLNGQKENTLLEYVKI